MNKKTIIKILMFGQWNTKKYIYKLSADFDRNRLVITRYDLHMQNPCIVWEGR